MELVESDQNTLEVMQNDEYAVRSIGKITHSEIGAIFSQNFCDARLKFIQDRVTTRALRLLAADGLFLFSFPCQIPP